MLTDIDLHIKKTTSAIINDYNLLLSVVFSYLAVCSWLYLPMHTGNTQSILTRWESSIEAGFELFVNGGPGSDLFFNGDFHVLHFGTVELIGRNPAVTAIDGQMICIVPVRDAAILR